MRTNSTKLAYATLTVTGAAALALSIIYTSSILAFIGLGLLFWGIICNYIRTEEYVKRALLDATTFSQLTTLNQIMKELDCKGDAIYLPPKYLKDTEAYKAYIPKQKETKLPTPEQIQAQEHQFSIKNPPGVLLTPPGAELTKLFERTLETDFTRVDLNYLQQNMPKLFIEDIEIAEDLEMEIAYSKVAKRITDSVSPLNMRHDIIHVKMTNSIYGNLHKEVKKLSYICDTLGCPICSAIACAISKASGNPVIIEKTESTEDGKVIEAYYRIIQEK